MIFENGKMQFVFGFVSLLVGNVVAVGPAAGTTKSPTTAAVQLTTGDPDSQHNISKMRLFRISVGTLFLCVEGPRSRGGP